MQAGAIVVVALVAVIGEHELDLAPLRELGRLIEHEPPATDPRLQGQRHAGQRSTIRDPVRPPAHPLAIARPTCIPSA